MNEQPKDRILKDNKSRHAEYYGMQAVFDELHKKSNEGKKFKQLMGIIASKENILLAYRNIKRNKGSYTPSVDRITIEKIERMPQDQLLKNIENRFNNYQPNKVRRKEIPKPNGKTRPLGIPSLWDRLIQQCILQVLEPICEAKFNTRSYGFRPNRSAEHAIADANFKINQTNLTYVVDVDIKSFFDEVNHVKLMRQLWTFGIQDKQLLVVLRKILKAPIQLEDGTIVNPTKGTPQGGILSPLLANVNLNEFDWWISDQWETAKTRCSFKYKNKEGRTGRDNRALKKTKLKPMYIVRYDFKIFTGSRINAEKIFKAVQLWLEERLKLPISKEKSKVTNLKKQKSEFLGFTLKATKKGKTKTGKTKYVAETHMSPKAIKTAKAKLAKQIKKIQKPLNNSSRIKEIAKYNSMIIGIHNYYEIATHVNLDLRRTGYDIQKQMYNRLPKSKPNDKNTNCFTRHGEYMGKDKGIAKYVKRRNKYIRYLMKRPILHLADVKNKNPMMKRNAINKYTEEGRKLIHKNLTNVSETELKWLREHPILTGRATVEYNDNRMSLYVAQNGKCSITGEQLDLLDMHCHHKIPWQITRDDSYENLTLIKSDVHYLIHATKATTMSALLIRLNLNKKAIQKLDKLRMLVGNNCIIEKEIKRNIVANQVRNEQLTLF
ncbi:group II intron reverse transcriptase/maturase [Sporosarcina sp. resist]|uniref:group II intron reverse transcriptase/maturase n=1 Tax=Sporosarcina sp. resist TaxID=2762563 RepID=UPI00164E4CEC|nr:group II intron reverse transcriptase/maturase [Sporosarcina sp. resist]QNK89071.1 group II intron reverse transcriptase/maturase [Sporosarcina sp. resist]